MTIIQEFNRSSASLRINSNPNAHKASGFGGMNTLTIIGIIAQGAAFTAMITVAVKNWKTLLR